MRIKRRFKTEPSERDGCFHPVRCGVDVRYRAAGERAALIVDDAGGVADVADVHARRSHVTVFRVGIGPTLLLIVLAVFGQGDGSSVISSTITVRSVYVAAIAR